MLIQQEHALYVAENIIYFLSLMYSKYVYSLQILLKTELEYTDYLCVNNPVKTLTL